MKLNGDRAKAGRRRDVDKKRKGTVAQSGEKKSEGEREGRRI